MIEELAERLRLGFLGACAERAIRMEAIPRAIMLASQGFAAGFPFAIVVSALAPRNRDLADRLITRFHIRGSTAEQVRTLFLAPNDVRGAVTWLGVLFLLVAALNLAGSLQVVYERAFSAEHLGLRGRWRAALWLLAAAIYIGVFIQLRPNVYSGGSNIARAVLSIAGSFAFWWFTPRILLGPQLSGHRLLPLAALTTTAVAVLTVASPLYMPKMIEDDAKRFGTIGVAFALLSWMIVLAFLIVGSAVIASQIDRERRGIPRQESES